MKMTFIDAVKAIKLLHSDFTIDVLKQKENCEEIHDECLSDGEWLDCFVTAVENLLKSVSKRKDV